MCNLCNDINYEGWCLLTEPVEHMECQHCGEMADCHLTDDPYRAEIHPEDRNEDSWWCYKCWDRRKSDV